MRLEEELEKEARALGLRVRPEFVDGEAPVRPPILPSLSRRFSGAVRIPKSFLEVLTEDEIKCVFLHELAHIERRHLLKNIILGLVPLLCLSRFLPPEALLPAAFAIGLLVLAHHRRHEYEADRFAAERVSPGAMAGALRKLERGKGSLLLRISHPSAPDRILFLTRRQAVGC